MATVIPAHLLEFDPTGVDDGSDLALAYDLWDLERRDWALRHGYVVIWPDGGTGCDWGRFFADVKRQEAAA